MPKFLLLSAGKDPEEFVIAAEPTLIGRGPDCQMVLRDPAVSRHHAKILRSRDGYLVQDLHSTNGVLLNGERVSTQLLKNGDSLQIGSYALRFVADEPGQPKAPIVVIPDAAREPPAAAVPAIETTPSAYLVFVQGGPLGERQLLDKGLHKLGEPGGNLAVISRRVQGYFLLHLGGEPLTTLNGQPVQGGGVKLKTGDRIQVGNTSVEFFCMS